MEYHIPKKIKTSAAGSTSTLTELESCQKYAIAAEYDSLARHLVLVSDLQISYR
jgi:hypothetical protein